MPLRGVVPAIPGLPLALVVTEYLLAREGADCADLCVSDAKFGGVVEHGVDV